MKHLLLSLLALASLHAQTLTNVPTITGANVVTASDKVLLLDASTGQMAKVPFAELVNVPSLFSGYQPALVSGTNIKTVLGASVLGSGNLTLANLGLGTAATADTSIIGGVSKVLMTDSLGNVNLGSPSGNALTDPFNYVGPGNFVMQNNKVFGAAKASATPASLASGNGWIFRLQPWETHGGSFPNWIPEVLFDISGSLALIPTHRTQYGNNSPARDTAYMQFVSGSATSTDTLRASKGFTLRNYWWDGDSAERSSMGFQAVPTATSGTGNKVLRFWDDVEIYGDGITGTANQVGDLTGVQIGEMHKEGFWNPGISAAFATLSPTSNVYTQTCSKYRTVQQAKLTLSTTNELQITNQTNGQRGVIFVQQDATGSKTLTLPAGSLTPAGWELTATPSAVDRLAWEYDGANFLWTITKNYTAGPDPDVTSFVSAGRANISDAGQIAALTTFVNALKGAGVWSRFDAIYPFTGGNATAHSKNLKANTYNLTYVGTPLTHNADGVTGNSSGYALTGINLRTLSRTNSASVYLYSKTDSPLDGAYWFGATPGTEWFAVLRSGANPYVRGPNSNNQGPIAVTDFSSDFIINRSSASLVDYYFGAFSSVGTTAAVTNSPDIDFPIFARWNGSAYASATNMNIAMFAIGQSLTTGDWTVFRTAANAYQTALGRANP